jgi:hypothetical protein
VILRALFDIYSMFSEYVQRGLLSDLPGMSMYRVVRRSAASLLVGARRRTGGGS